MTAKQKVRQVYPRAIHKRYATNGPFARGYTLIWAEYGERHRLGEGKTTAAAWSDAWRHVSALQQVKAALPKVPEPTLEGRLANPLTTDEEAREQLKRSLAS